MLRWKVNCEKINEPFSVTQTNKHIYVLCTHSSIHGVTITTSAIQFSFLSCCWYVLSFFFRFTRSKFPVREKRWQCKHLPQVTVKAGYLKTHFSNWTIFPLRPLLLVHAICALCLCSPAGTILLYGIWSAGRLLPLFLYHNIIYRYTNMLCVMCTQRTRHHRCWIEYCPLPSWIVSHRAGYEPFPGPVSSSLCPSPITGNNNNALAGRSVYFWNYNR